MKLLGSDCDLKRVFQWPFVDLSHIDFFDITLARILQIGQGIIGKIILCLKMLKLRGIIQCNKYKMLNL